MGAQSGIPDPSHEVSPGTHGPFLAPVFRRPGQHGEQQQSLREAGPREGRARGACRAGGPWWSAPGSLSRYRRTPPRGAGTARRRTQPPGPTDLVVEVPQGTGTLGWGFGGKADSEHGQASPGCQGCRALPVAPAAVGVLAPDPPGIKSWASPPHLVGDVPTHSCAALSPVPGAFACRGARAFVAGMFVQRVRVRVMHVRMIVFPWAPLSNSSLW